MDRPPVEEIRFFLVPPEAELWVDLKKESDEIDALHRLEFYLHNVLETNEGTAVKWQRLGESYLVYMAYPAKKEPES